MTPIFVIFKRELCGYFVSPLAYIFIEVFLVLSGVLTFYVGGFFERNQADLVSFFGIHPWLYLFLAPALTMRLWAEERQSGNIELLLTLSVATRNVVLGKFFAAWVVAGVSLLLTFPLVISVNYLGNPDNGIIFAGYIGSWLLVGAYLSIGSCMSALAKSQVIALILTLVVCFLFVVSGFPLVLDALNPWAPQWTIDLLASISILARFEAISRGVIDVRDALYFFSAIAAWLTATTVVVNLKKAE
ncbi:ABC transporter permease subunit [Pseudomonas sp. R2-7-07]|uniref:ABC transporter permease subunit n=1 Tax=Pseudomonas sp. R2-7-07 TaxID=658641 RepID=UPI000F576368|nr:ABC transporter permease subunit [Pseudomonas sp. R2-7-07]AZF46053.1 Gliding motility-associated ABC transporter permease protein GldF [Pseudomonas sp. R2-7-07]